MVPMETAVYGLHLFSLFPAALAALFQFLFVFLAPFVLFPVELVFLSELVPVSSLV